MDAQENDFLTHSMSLGSIADFHRINIDPGEEEAVGDNSPDPPQHHQIWQFAIAVLALIGSIVWGVYLFTSNMGRDYITAREYSSQIESVKDLIKDTNTQLHEFKRDLADEINQRLNGIQSHFDQDDRRLSDIERRVGDRK